MVIARWDSGALKKDVICAFPFILVSAVLRALVVIFRSAISLLVGVKSGDIGGGGGEEGGVVASHASSENRTDSLDEEKSRRSSFLCLPDGFRWSFHPVLHFLSSSSSGSRATRRLLDRCIGVSSSSNFLLPILEYVLRGRF